MSFEPQPYAVIVDDLLTAMTGGHVREEHRFRLGTLNYTPKHPVDESRLSFVKVVGERNGGFQLFERGKDYDVIAGVIVWLNQGGKLPDIDSTFIISYYEQGRVAPLTDRFVGSVTRTLAEALALEIGLLQQSLAAAYESAFVDTASGGALDQVVALLGVTRRSAQYATGEVLFTRAAGVRGDIDIKAGTQLSTATDPSLAFETTATKTLRDGQLSIKVPVRAMLTGPQINAQPGELSIMARPIAGIQSVTNPEGTAQGQAGETDDELRERAKQMLAGSGNATLPAMQNALLGVPGVRSVSLQEDMDNQPGQVLLTVDCSEAAVGQVLATLENTRAAGVRVVHNLIPPSGAGSGPTPGQVTLTTVNAEVRMALALADGNVTQETIARMLNNVRDGIVAYLDTLKVGQALAYGKLVSLAMAVDGVADVASLTIRRLDKTPPEDLAAGKNLEIEPGQKVKVAANALSVEVDGAPVNLDVVIALASGVFNEADLRSALQAFLAANRDIVGLVPMWQALTTPALTLSQLSATAEYSATGASVTRTIAGATVTPGPDNQFRIAANEQAVLRSVRCRPRQSSVS